MVSMRENKTLCREYVTVWARFKSARCSRNMRAGLAKICQKTITWKNEKSVVMKRITLDEVEESNTQNDNTTEHGVTRNYTRG